MKTKLRRGLSLFLAAWMFLSLAACTGNHSVESNGTAVERTDTPAETGSDTVTVADTESDTATETESESKTISETNERTEIEVEIYENGYTNRLIVGFDEYGRSVSAVSATREDREVGIFYFLWLGQHATSEIYYTPAIREEIGDKRFFHQIGNMD